MVRLRCRIKESIKGNYCKFLCKKIGQNMTSKLELLKKELDAIRLELEDLKKDISNTYITL
jgi:hypothetical protein